MNKNQDGDMYKEEKLTIKPPTVGTHPPPWSWNHQLKEPAGSSFAMLPFRS